LTLFLLELEASKVGGLNSCDRAAGGLDLAELILYAQQQKVNGRCELTSPLVVIDTAYEGQKQEKTSGTYVEVCCK
jgi:hypothetical protein